MDGNIYETTTNGAYQVCSVCHCDLTDRAWQWTEQPRLYFCGPEHAKLFADCKGVFPEAEEEDWETDAPLDGEEPKVRKRPGRIRRWLRRLTDGDTE